MTKTDFRRALRSPGFIAAYAGTVVIVLINAFLELLPMLEPDMLSMGLMYGQHAALIQAALSSRLVLMATPILCALPYTAAFIDDHRSGLIKLYVPRCGKRSYVKSKLMATAISGGLPLFLGILTAYFIAWLAISPLELALQEGMPKEAMLYPVVLKAALFMLCGGFWSMVGALSGTLTMNKYMAYASPFIFYYLLVILCERYIKKLYVLNPYEWLVYSIAVSRRLYDAI